MPLLFGLQTPLPLPSPSSSVARMPACALALVSSVWRRKNTPNRRPGWSQSQSISACSTASIFTGGSFFRNCFARPPPPKSYHPLGLYLEADDLRDSTMPLMASIFQSFMPKQHDGALPPVHTSETHLPRQYRTILAQLLSNCELNTYVFSIGLSPHCPSVTSTSTQPLLECPAFPTWLTLIDL